MTECASMGILSQGFTLMTASALVVAALDYAARGWPIFPTHPSTKRPLTAHGFLDATSDEGTLREWWKRWPKAMLAVPTGAAIGAFVIDVDAGVCPKTGEVFEADTIIAELEREFGIALPATWTAATPRNGRPRWHQPCLAGVQVVAGGSRLPGAGPDDTARGGPAGLRRPHS